MLKLLSGCPQISNASNILAKRGYAFKSDLKIKWVRPERILCIKPQKSGDQSSFPQLNKSQYVLEYRNSEELKTANEHVQRQFQLGFNRRRKSTEFYSRELVDSVKRHNLDSGSMEAKLAAMTATIRSLQVQMDAYPRNKRLQVILKEMIDCRKKFLRHLRVWDYKRFEWVLERLDLIYKAYPSEYHWITRKESLVKLTNLHCDDIRDTRLKAYRDQLQAQQIGFLEQKLKNLQFIRREQLDCGIAVTVSTEEISDVSSKLATIQAKQNTELEEDAASKAN